MKLARVPTLDLPESYNGIRTSEYVLWWTEWYDLTDLGVRLDELPDDLFETKVFYHFYQVIAGKFTGNGSIFRQNWRYMPAAERMAWKLGAAGLADALAAAWEDVQQLPLDILDDFDAGRIVWGAPQSESRSTLPDWAVQPRTVSDQLGQHVSDLLDMRWDALANTFPPSDPSPSGDSDNPWENALAAYLARQELPLEHFDASEPFAARVREIIEGLDDCGSRKIRCYTGCDLAALLDLAGLRFLGEGRNSFSAAKREDAPPISLRDYVRSAGIDPVGGPEGQKRAVKIREEWLQELRRQRASAKRKARREQPLFLVETRTTGGPMLQAHYPDKVALVDPEGLTELAVMDLPPQQANNPAWANCWLYSEAPRWRPDDALQPVVVR
ncbi:MAG: hypothetical protein AAFR79_00975 [Pseudomonadota bacterium]